MKTIYEKTFPEFVQQLKKQCSARTDQDLLLDEEDDEELLRFKQNQARQLDAFKRRQDKKLADFKADRAWRASNERISKMGRKS